MLIQIYLILFFKKNNHLIFSCMDEIDLIFNSLICELKNRIKIKHIFNYLQKALMMHPLVGVR